MKAHLRPICFMCGGQTTNVLPVMPGYAEPICMECYAWKETTGLKGRSGYYHAFEEALNAHLAARKAMK